MREETTSRVLVLLYIYRLSTYRAVSWFYTATVCVYRHILEIMRAVYDEKRNTIPAVCCKNRALSAVPADTVGAGCEELITLCLK